MVCPHSVTLFVSSKVQSVFEFARSHISQQYPAISTWNNQKFPWHPEKVRSIFADIIGDPYLLDNKDDALGIVSRLDGLLPERQDGEIIQNVKKLSDLSSMADASLKLLHYAVFLSSNNLLDNSQMDSLLKWIIKTDQSFLIERLIKIKTPTVEIFLSHLLLGATGLSNIYATKATLALSEVTVEQKIQFVRLLLNAGADPNASIAFGQGMSPLQLSMHGLFKWELVQILLDAGADPNVAPVGDLALPPLLTSAAFASDTALVRILLNAKAEVNMMTKSSDTALQTAAYNNDVEIVQILLEAGADIDAPFGNWYQTARGIAAENDSYYHLVSPIQFAAYCDNIEMVQMLLDLDANVEGYTLAEEDGYLRDDDDDNKVDDFYDEVFLQTPLQLAVSNRNHILVRLLLFSGADVNSQQCGGTPLQLAAGNDDVVMVRLLLRKGAHVNAAAHRYGGKTALQAAAYIGSSDIVQILLDEGADNGRTATQAAAQGGHIGILRTLNNLGADVNAKASPRRGRTCLQAAAENRHTEMISILLRYGAEVNAPAAGKMGRTALQAAIRGDNSASVDILLDAGADINAAPSELGGMSALYGAIYNNDLELTRRLLATGDPNGATGRYPPIVEAVKHGNIDLVQSLINAGADVNALLPEEKSQSALQAAVGYDNIELIRILLEAQADVNAFTTDELIRLWSLQSEHVPSTWCAFFLQMAQMLISPLMSNVLLAQPLV